MSLLGPGASSTFGPGVGSNTGGVLRPCTGWCHPQLDLSTNPVCRSAGMTAGPLCATGGRPWR